MQHSAIVLLSAVFAICGLCQWLAWRIQLPPILLLLAAGLVAGPVSGLIDADQLLGPLLLPLVSLSVAIILFEGSLTLRFGDILGLGRVIRNLLTVGMLLTWLTTALATHFFLAVAWPVAILFGAIMVVTGPTVIAPLLRTVRPTAKVGRILHWESVLIDSLGAMLAILVYEFLVSEGGKYGLVLTFSRVVLIGTALGAGCGYLFGLLLRHRLIPDFLQNILTLATVFSAFALADTLQRESGLVTVTVMGLWLANMKDVDLEVILDFKETLSTILISLLFILLTTRLEPAPLLAMGLPALLVLGVIQFLARPLAVMVSTLGSDLTPGERRLLAWIAPRGIVAAAISSLFAFKLEHHGTEDAQLLVPLCFMVIIATVVLQGATARPIARLLGVMQPEPRGFLIVGANRLARQLASALAATGVRVVVTDTSRDNIAQARILGLETYQGNPVSSHARRHLDLVGIGSLLALSPHESENLAACLGYRRTFGKDRVAMIRIHGLPDQGHDPPLFGQRHALFHPECTYRRLTDRLAENGLLIEPAGHHAPGPDQDPWLLFAIDDRGRVHPRLNRTPVPTAPGWQVIRVADAPQGPP